jgi:hypothetical protein
MKLYYFSSYSSKALWNNIGIYIPEKSDDLVVSVCCSMKPWIVKKET